MGQGERPLAVEKLDGVDVEQLERVFWLLRNKLPQVFAANRYFEEQTGFHNEAGTNNIVDALSHFATLIERADELGKQGQAEQVAHLEDHLRRSMMEAFEQTLKFALSDAAELWGEYLERAYPLLGGRSSAIGIVSMGQLNEMRGKVAELLEIGRQSKRMTSWEDWEEGTGALAEACDVAEKLVEALGRSLAAADAQIRIRRRNLLVGFGIGLAFALGVLIGHLA
jgi:hypothetical protein